TPGSLSITINRLATKHLLRVYCQLNFPQIGLQHIVLLFDTPSLETHQKLKRKLAKVQYAVVTRSIDRSLLMTTFYIPSQNLDDFQRWVKKLCRKWNLYPPQIKEVTDIVSTRNFQNYTPNAGWDSDFTSTLELIGHIIRERATKIAPPFHSFKYSYPNPMEKHSSLKLRPEDFTFFQRMTDSITVTDTASSRIAREARQLGLSKLGEKVYDRRVRKLSKIGVQSDPFGIGLIHLGLNATLDIYIRSSREITELVLRGLQLLPHLFSGVFNDGDTVARLFLPNAVAIETFSFLRTLFAECEIYAQIGVKPAWATYDYPSSPINPNNYDFEKGEWGWDSDIIPEP
ncbi:hypothetical protein KA005_80810, partial [bacterium]|nr:hypothetical protein [bacterium]